MITLAIDNLCVFEQTMNLIISSFFGAEVAQRVPTREFQHGCFFVNNMIQKMLQSPEPPMRVASFCACACTCETLRERISSEAFAKTWGIAGAR